MPFKQQKSDQKLGGGGGTTARKRARFDCLALKITKDTIEIATTSNTMPTRNASTSDSGVVGPVETCMKRIGQQKIMSATLAVGEPGNSTFRINKFVSIKPTTRTPVARDARIGFMGPIVT